MELASQSDQCDQVVKSINTTFCSCSVIQYWFVSWVYIAVQESQAVNNLLNNNCLCFFFYHIFVLFRQVL